MLRGSAAMKRLALLLLLLVLSSVVHAQRGPQELLDMARAGAPGLSLTLMDRLQPDSERQRFAWLSWERARLDILFGAARWQDLVDRVNGYPADLPPEFLAWAHTRQAEAWLRLENGEAARHILRSLLWQVVPRPEADAFRYWRRLVIESYLVDARLEDAHTALQRYTQDYGEAGGDETILRGRVLLRVGEAEAAARILADDTRGEARALAMLAALRAPEPDADTLRRQAQAAAGEAGLSQGDRARFWFVAAEGAAAQQDEIKRAWYLERALLHDRYLGERDAVFAYSGDALWSSYLAIGRAEGNARQLLIGDDAAWLAAAAALDSQSLMRRRAFLAVVALHGTTPKGQAEAHAGLINTFLGTEGADEIVAGLYLNTRHFVPGEAMPVAARQVLSDYALARGDVRLASALMEGLNRAPPDADPFDWQLRRARIHILGGHEEEGIDTLYGVLAQFRELDKDQADRFMQVLFDLQTAKRHAAVITLFTALAPRITDPQQRREVLFWQADSYKAQGDYERAAWLYLQSATLLDPHAFDPWAQTSRFYAAEALAEAGLTEDARRIYEQLMQATSKPERQLVLRQKLQALRLQE
jgi:hypothetical protein